jgi:hypothetical protein
MDAMTAAPIRGVSNHHSNFDGAADASVRTSGDEGSGMNFRSKTL